MADHVGVYEVTGSVILPAPPVSPVSVLPQSGSITGALPGKNAVVQPEFNLARELPQSSYTYDATGSVIPLNSSSGWGFDDWSGSLTSYTYVSGTATFITGAGYGDVYGEFSSSQSEVSRLNAFFSGTATLDPASAVPTTYPLYYSKESLINFLTASHIPTILDVYNNIPDASPSRSALIAPISPGPGPQLTGNLAQFGVTFGAPPAGELFVTNWTTYLAQTGPSPSLFPTQAFTALSANLVQVSGFYAAVTNSFFVSGAYTTIILSLAQDGHGGYLTQSGFPSLTPGLPVKIFSWQELSSSFSGTFCNKTVYVPTIIPLPITASGKIRDMRVRVELLHDERLIPTKQNHGLQGLALALRSPNVSFRSAHPLWNSPIATGFPITTNPAVLTQIGTYGTLYSGVPALLQNSYLLWSGQGTEAGLQDALSAPVYSASYHMFDTDIDMRTIFWDSSPANNPRDVTALYPSLSFIPPAPGTPLPYNTLTTSASFRQYYQSPTNDVANEGVISGTGASWTSFLAMIGTGSLTCSNIPWMLDDRNGLPPGALNGVAYTTSSSTPALWSPPVYSGSYGVQLGPQTIRPMYPILDDAYALKVLDYQPNASTFVIGINHPQILGVRPGLRTTELSGAWQFLVGVAPSTYNNGYHATNQNGVWLRQVRFEVVYSIGIGPETFNPASIRRYERPANVKTDGYQLQAVQSGSCAWDVGLNYVEELNTPDYGRTVLITDASSSSPDSYAVLTYITGTLYTDLSASGVVSTANPNPPWFLNFPGKDVARPTGIPYIPDSSMSLGLPRLSASDIDVLANSELLMQAMGTSSIPPANDITAFLKRQGYSQTQADLYATAVSAAYSAAIQTNYFGP
jgi:hypothetical protein